MIYGCTCTRQEIAAAAPVRPGDEPRYPGTCRDRGIAPGPGVVWRMELEPGVEVFQDLMCGRQEQNPSAQCGDVAIRDRHGNWTYQFVASVDDYLQEIDLVVRGRDLLASTGRQMQIARALGRETPAVFAHHDLIMKSPTQKLSKSDGDTGIRELREKGLAAAQVLAMASTS